MKQLDPGVVLYWEISISSLKCMKFDNDYYLRGLVSIFHFYTNELCTPGGLLKCLCIRVGVLS